MSVLGAAATAAGAPGILLPVVLTAALLHASWNAILKLIPDKLTASLLMTLSAGVLAGIGVFFLPDKWMSGADKNLTATVVFIEDQIAPPDTWH